MATAPSQIKPEVVSGPYWLRITEDGSHEVCGRFAKVIRKYPPTQEVLADADCRRLQKRFAADDERARDAAQDMLLALRAIVEAIEGCDDAEAIAIARTAIAKATGEAA